MTGLKEMIRDAGKMAAPAVQGEPEITPEMIEAGARHVTIIDSAAESAEKVYRAMWAAAPQPEEQKQPYRQSPPDDPLGGLEHRADGEANFYTLSRPTGSWVARIQFNGELHVQEQERILNAMLGDRNARYGDGYHQGYWDARQDSPDVARLAGLLEHARCNTCDGSGALYDGHGPVEQCQWCHDRSAALAEHRKQGGGE